MITQQLKQNALYRYSEILKTTRTDFMKPLQLKISDRNEQNIRERSFLFNYMIESHEKYIRLLSLLEKSKLALALLKRFYDGLTCNPLTNINQFIAEAHQLMQSEEFQLDLRKLLDKFNVLANGGVCGSLLFWASAVISIIALPSLASVPVSSLIIIAGAALLFLSLATENARVDIKKANNSLLEDKDHPLYQQKHVYSYDTVDLTDDCLISTEIKRTPKPQSKSQPRERFFQPDGSREPLSESLRREFSNTF